METCEYCGSREIVKRRIRDTFWHDGQLTIIEDVPVEICRRCGERYYEAAVLEAMDGLARSADGVRRVLWVPVKQFVPVESPLPEHTVELVAAQAHT